MSIPDEEIRQKVVQRPTYGDEDLRLARHGLTMSSSIPCRLIAYHAQQCAEKHLKAYSPHHQLALRRARAPLALRARDAAVFVGGRVPLGELGGGFGKLQSL